MLRWGCRWGYPVRDPFTRPLVVVVEVQDHGPERQPLLAPFGAGSQRVLEALEEPREVVWANALRLAGQSVHPFVRRAQRARGSAPLEILAERLLWT